MLVWDQFFVLLKVRKNTQIKWLHTAEIHRITIGSLKYSKCKNVSKSPKSIKRPLICRKNELMHQEYTYMVKVQKYIKCIKYTNTQIWMWTLLNQSIKKDQTRLDSSKKYQTRYAKYCFSCCLDSLLFLRVFANLV